MKRKAEFRIPARRVKIHVIDTEASDFDAVLTALERRRQAVKAWKTRRANAEAAGNSAALTLKQELAFAEHRTRVKLGLVERRQTRLILPHPFKDLSPEDKATRVREMYDHGVGHWGIGPIAFRRLARVFGVPVGQIIEWVR